MQELGSPSAPAKQPTRIGDVLGGWAACGPLLHEPTGIARLDELTGGGPVYGTRWFLAGAPDAGKTALLVQLLHVNANKGITVGLLAVDEEPTDIVTRLAQRVGYSRTHCEVRDSVVLEQMRGLIGELRFFLYDSTWTIEATAADLAIRAKAAGTRAMLGIDPVQTVKCDLVAAPAKELSEVSAITANVHAIRAVATKHQMIVIATSEMGRGAYRTSDPAQQTSTMAAGKWSGAIEYSARVLIGLRSVAGEPDLIEVELAKNKHGPRDERFHLNRGAQSLWQANYDPPPDGRESAREDAARERVVRDAAAVALVLVAKPGIAVRALRSAVKATAGFGVERTGAALSLLGESVIERAGPQRSKLLSLELDGVPEHVRREMEKAK